jgi:hypothetical protein
MYSFYVEDPSTFNALANQIYYNVEKNIGERIPVGARIHSTNKFSAQVTGDLRRTFNRICPRYFDVNEFLFERLDSIVAQ